MKYLHVGANPDRFLIITAAVCGLIWLFNSWKLGKFKRSKAAAAKEGNRRILLPILMILLGIAQIVMGIMEIRMPLVTGTIGVIFLVWGIKILRDAPNSM